MSDPSNQNTVDLLFEADTHEINQDYISAYAGYSHILEINPNHTAARFGKGRCAARLNSLTRSTLDEACNEIQFASQPILPEHMEIANNTARILVESVFNTIRNLENEYQGQLLAKLNESSSRFSTSGFGGSINQQKLEAINRDQNTHFCSQITSLTRALDIAWSISSTVETALQILVVIDLVKNSQVLLYETAIRFNKPLEPLTLSIAQKYPELINQKSGGSRSFSVWILLAIVVGIIGLLWIITRVTR